MNTIVTITVCLICVCRNAIAYKMNVMRRGAVTMSASASTLQADLFAKIDGALSLKLTDYTDAKCSAQTWNDGDYSGTCEWFEETKGSKLTGVSKNTICGKGYFSYTVLHVYFLFWRQLQPHRLYNPPMRKSTY